MPEKNNILNTKQKEIKDDRDSKLTTETYGHHTPNYHDYPSKADAIPLESLSFLVT